MIILTDYSACVYEIQSALRTLSIDNQTIRPQLIPDGIYGPITRQVVKGFQRDCGMPETGVVDYDTWQALFSPEF